MKTKADLVKGLLLKAESNLVNVKMCIKEKKSLDTACFHSQQAAEKFLKAYLTVHDIEYPYIHNLEKLIELCAEKSSIFTTIKVLGQSLTPYAVELRYDHEFWPNIETAREALEAALGIKEMVMGVIPDDMKPAKGLN